MAARKLRKKIFLFLLSVVLLLALALVALPLWFPWALRPIAKRYGATFATYQRIGYQRFQLSDVAFTNGPTALKAQQVTGFVPTAWLWRHLTGNRDEQFLEVHSWQYAAVPNTSARTNASPASAHKTFQSLQPIASTLQNWLPTATLTDGTVVIQKQTIAIPTAVWTNGNLTATVSISNQPPLTVVASPAQSGPWKLRIDCQPEQFRSEFSITERPDKLDLSGAIDWRTNRINVAAAFPAHGFIPDTASIRADAFHLRTEVLRSAADLQGVLRADWQSNHFDVQLNARAIESATNIPPLDIELHASGDTNTAHIDVARISTPALHAELPAPVALSFRPPFLSQPTSLNVAVDLDKQHLIVAGGTLNGRAVVYPAEKIPRATFTLTGRGVTATSLTTSNLDVEGELNWPVLDIQRATVVMDDTTHMEFACKYDFTRKIVSDGRLNSSGAFGGQFLPAGYSFQTATISGTFAGPIAAITNSVRAQISQFTAPGLNPVNAVASWTGEGLNVKEAEVTLKTGASSLRLRGSTSFESKRRSLTLTALELSNSNGIALRLEQPTQITLEQVAGATTNKSWTVSLDPLRLVGANREFSLAGSARWPESGTIQCEAHGLDARLLRDFIRHADIDAQLNHLTFNGGWTNGPVEFQLDAEAAVTTHEQYPFSATAKITGGKNGISIDQFSVLATTQIVSRADGTLPISFNPGSKNGLLQIDEQAPLKLRAFTDPRSVLWKKIADATGLRLEQPNLTANLEGTWARPQGQITLQIERVGLPSTTHPLPPIENVDILAVTDRSAARVSQFNFDIAGQPVRITASIPLGEKFWAGLRSKNHLPDWQQATAHLTIDHAELAPFTPLLPQVLSAEGAASADISLEPGGNFRGTLSITNARTHPIESIGPVRNIHALAHLEGRTVRLDNASGEIGGQRVNVDGSMELNEQIWRTNGLPLFQVHLNGTNVPLARNPSVLLRANLDLTVTNSGKEIPVVYGTVKLRDSLFLADLQALVPERASSPRQRPPYFSLETDPWAQWKLKVAVTGDSFLRVQTPLFRGKVSAVLSVEGTLKDPIALGQVKIDSGSDVTFPFSSLDVRQGFISLTSEDPYRPTLFITAQGRRFGYDVKMEATGPVDAPVVQFSAVPGLSSEDIVLMLTAGQIPRGTGTSATTQQRAQGLALFVGKNLLSDFGLGGGGEERLTFHSGEEISAAGHPTYGIEYQLTGRWSVIGEYDRFDQYNLNVKYKIYSK